jgi:hypothetical protein
VTTTPAPAPLPTLSERLEALDAALRDASIAAQLAHQSAVARHRTAIAGHDPSAMASAHLAERHLAEVLDGVCKLRGRL